MSLTIMTDISKQNSNRIGEMYFNISGSFPEEQTKFLSWL